MPLIMADFIAISTWMRYAQKFSILIRSELLRVEYKDFALKFQSKF